MTYDEMAALHHACFAHLRPWSAQEMAGLLANSHAFAITAPQGFLLARCVAGEAEIQTLAVDPACRRIGIGRDLVLRFLARARNASAETAFLDVAADNVAAIALYHALGFTAGPRRRAYYRGADGVHVDAILMSCRVLPQSTEI